ncbi:MAG: putative transrane anti-sigma factor [Mycobacterium sp.]|nr:putative transrane anti-sigma factor [Mycobacterium sp.]
MTGGTGQAPHAEYEVLAAGWSLHALEPDDEERFAAHLAECETCRRTVAELADTIGELAYAAPAVEPPPELLERLRAAVAAEEARGGAVPDGEDGRAHGAPGPRRDPGSGAGVVVPFRGRSRNRDRGSVRERIAWIAAAAAVVVLVALGGWNLSLRHEVRHQQRIAAERGAMLEQVMQPGRRMAALVPDSDDKRPVAYVLSRGGNLEVATSGMARNAAGKTSFWLWAISGDNSRRPLGRFDVESGQLALHNLGPVPAGMDSVARFAVSMEPGTAKPSRPTSIVAQGQVDS